MSSSLSFGSFKRKFAFDPAKKLFVGVEREAFLTNASGSIVPEAQHVLGRLEGDPRFGYELSACQVESRVGPCLLGEVADRLREAESFLQENLGGLRLSHEEVGPPDMPLDIFPDPSGRYARIAAGMPRHVLAAACRVIGTHVHVGMSDHDSALRAYNFAVPRFSELCMRGNGSYGERLAAYKVVASGCEPRQYADWEDFFRFASEAGFAEHPRNCWTLIRISRHGTIEFRMFGATASIERIAGWAELCHGICQEALG